MSRPEERLTHLGPDGKVRMVDVGDRPVTEREATAEGEVLVNRAAYAAISARSAPKGEVLEVARLAGIMGAKSTPGLIPLCHPLNLTHVAVEAELRRRPDRVRLRATVRCHGTTGVEMEALTAVAVAGLTVVDMVKSLDPWVRIGSIQLVAKSGGRSGSVRRDRPGAGGHG